MQGHSASQADHAPAAVLLAAGLGRRLGGVPKSALHIDGRSLFERLVDALRGAGIEDIGAVIGPYADVLLPLAQRCGVRVIRQPVLDAPLATSQRLAVQDHLRHHPPGRALLLLVADLPLLAREDLVPLLQAWAQRSPGVEARMPVVGGVRGHPVCLSWVAVQAVAERPAGQGVRDWLAVAGDAVQPVVTDREAHVTDLDTPADLEALRRRLWPLTVEWPG